MDHEPKYSTASSTGDATKAVKTNTQDSTPLANSDAPEQAEQDQLKHARSVTYLATREYWHSLLKQQGVDYYQLPLRQIPPGLADSTATDQGVEEAITTGRAAAGTAPDQAGYSITSLYTALMPEQIRTNLGAYYTPPAVANRMIELSTLAGIDWKSARTMDPACGGGAFLAPLARKMLESMESQAPRDNLEDLESRLRGYEIDPFAAWLAQVFLDAVLMDLALQAGRPPANVVTVCDALKAPEETQLFDLVIGNPPYVKQTLEPEVREKFQRSIYGHANLYGLFTDLALRLARPGGVITYVVPTSFLSGAYFKSLRQLLEDQAPPRTMEFIDARKGIFQDVLQETVMMVCHKNPNETVGTAGVAELQTEGPLATSLAGSFTISRSSGRLWLIPRAPQHNPLIQAAKNMSHRLADYGYEVNTGHLVWNRNKDGLRETSENGTYPLIWAESIRPDGEFTFGTEQKHQYRYFKPGPREQGLITARECVLLQRTTAKEQDRRLIAARLPQEFVEDHGGVVIENHVNIIMPQTQSPGVPTTTLTSLLNSDTVNELFRCINGSVAVSAYELEDLPLPGIQDLQRLNDLVSEASPRQDTENEIRQLYGGAAP